MNKLIQTLYIWSPSFKVTKNMVYVFFAFLIGLIQLLEDLADQDAEGGKVLFQFFVIVLFLSGVFIGLGKVFLRFRELIVNRFPNLNGRYLVLLLGLLLVLLPVGLILTASSKIMAEEIWAWSVRFFIFLTIIVGVELFWLQIFKQHELELTNEKLLRTQEMTKYQALMNQLNPHFLFNSLNTLSYLVYQSPETADRFIGELSNMYRYIIQLNADFLVSLKREMEFIDSYLFLQKIRHQDHILVEKNIPADYLQRELPPLTLEVLVENAIKHNMVSATHPLTIQIYVEDDFLIVKNNIQSRNEDVVSTLTGIKNLNEKFRILNSPLPEFLREDGFFIAKIPLK